MTDSVLDFIQKASKRGEKLLAILLDPDKTSLDEIPTISKRIKNLNAHFIFVGGSFVENGITNIFVQKLKKTLKFQLFYFREITLR